MNPHRQATRDFLAQHSAVVDFRRERPSATHLEKIFTQVALGREFSYSCHPSKDPLPASKKYLLKFQVDSSAMFGYMAINRTYAIVDQTYVAVDSSSPTPKRLAFELTLELVAATLCCASPWPEEGSECEGCGAQLPAENQDFLFQGTIAEFGWVSEDFEGFAVVWAQWAELQGEDPLAIAAQAPTIWAWLKECIHGLWPKLVEDFECHDPRALGSFIVRDKP